MNQRKQNLAIIQQNALSVLQSTIEFCGIERPQGECLQSRREDNVLTIVQDSNNPANDTIKKRLNDVALVGGNEPIWVGSSLPVTKVGNKSGIIFVSFFTPDVKYSTFATNLRQTLEAFNVKFYLREIELSGRWEEICAIKARFIRECWEDSDVPVVWLDADATLESVPLLLQSDWYDFAISKFAGWQLSSGTVGFGRSEYARKLLDRWVTRCEADPLTWDQVHLDAAWADVSSTDPLRTLWLPSSYLAIKGIYDESAMPRPVVRHWQASRSETDKLQYRVSLSTRGQQARRFSRFERDPIIQFWISRGLEYIIPNVGQEYPEGFDVGRVIRDILAENLPVTEIGCGVGRIAKQFDPSIYAGYDVNPNAILIAKKRLPDHKFRILLEDADYPKSHVLLFYTVLLHIPDGKVENIIRQAAQACNTVLVCECLGRSWRRGGGVPVFNRSEQEYIEIFSKFGLNLTKKEVRPYRRYADNAAFSRHDTNIYFLRFDRT